MEDQTRTFADCRLTQEMQPTNPIEKTRKPTDRLFIFVFSLIVIAWLAIGISGLCAEQKANINDETSQAYAYVKELINAPFERITIALAAEQIAVLFLSIIIPFLCILQIEYTSIIFYLGTVIYALYTIISCCGYIRGDTAVDNYIYETKPTFYLIRKIFNLLSDPWFIMKTMFMIPSVFSYSIVGQYVPRNIMKDLIRVVRGSPLLIFFAILISLLQYLVFLFTINAVITDLLSDRSTYRTVADTFILIFGGICVIYFLYNFAVTVISEYTVNCYWKNGGTVVIIECTAQILRNHMGTIMLSSTLFIPHICAIVQALKHKPSWKNTENYLLYVVSKVSLVLSMDYIALIFSSIHGSDFMKSTKKTYDTVLRRCSLYLATLGVIDALCGVIYIVIGVIIGIRITIDHFGFLMEAVDSQKKVDVEEYIKRQVILDEKIRMLVASVSYAYVVPFYAYLTLIYSSARALLINKIIILNKEDEHTEGKTEILNRMQ